MCRLHRSNCIIRRNEARTGRVNWKIAASGPDRYIFLSKKHLAKNYTPYGVINACRYFTVWIYTLNDCYATSSIFTSKRVFQFLFSSFIRKTVIQNYDTDCLKFSPIRIDRYPLRSLDNVIYTSAIYTVSTKVYSKVYRGTKHRRHFSTFSLMIYNLKTRIRKIYDYVTLSAYFNV